MYLVFEYIPDEANGGMNDCTGVYATLEAAQQAPHGDPFIYDSIEIVHIRDDGRWAFVALLGQDGWALVEDLNYADT